MPIPLAEQSVKAGFPSPAQDYMEGEIDLNDILVRHREATFYVRISGDSMKDAGILNDMCDCIESNKKAGIYDGAYKVVELAFGLKNK